MESLDVYQNNLYYKPSGKFNAGKTILFTLLAAIVVAGLSFVYPMLTAIIPFVYLNFIFTAVMGGCIGACVYFIVRWANIRNNIVTGIIGIILFLVFVYAHFLGYATYFVSEFIEDVSFGYALQIHLQYPNELFLSVQALNAEGTWQISDWVFSGWMLTIIWVIEHIAVLALSLWPLLMRKEQIFIESMNCWAEEKPFEKLITPQSKMIKEQFEHKNFSSIERAQIANEASDHCIISYFTDAMDQSKEYYLKAENVSWEQAEKNSSKMEKKVDTLLVGLRISQTELASLRTAVNDLKVESHDEAVQEE